MPTGPIDCDLHPTVPEMAALTPYLDEVWREAVVRDRELQALHQQIEAWTAQQLTFLFQALLYMPGARQDVDSETLAWELTLLLLRLAENPLEEPDAVVASLTSLICHGLFTDSTA